MIKLHHFYEAIAPWLQFTPEKTLTPHENSLRKSGLLLLRCYFLGSALGGAQAGGERDGESLKTVVDAEFLENVLDMIPLRLGADTQGVGDALGVLS